MVNWSKEQLAIHEAKESVQILRNLGSIDEPESKLHQSIMDYCNSQWPRWKFIRSRMDKESSIQIGAQDFTIFIPGGRALCVECKRKSGKVRPNQLVWAMEMDKLGHRVHVIRSLDEFLSLVDSTIYPREHKQHD